MQNRLFGLVVFLSVPISACLLQQPEESAGNSTDDVVGEAMAEKTPARFFQLSRQDIYASSVKRPSLDTGDGQTTDDGQDEIPTDIMFATCESSPDEVAVPLNPLEDRTCDVVQAIAYRSDDTGSYEVSADFVWSIADQDVATFHFMSGHGFDKVQRPQAQLDLFATDAFDSEPETIVTACAIPRDSASHLFEPLCVTLPLRTVVNVEASWCFDGTTFDSACDVVGFRQDGRYLSLDGSTAQDGDIFVRHVEFVRQGFRYVGSLLSSSYMYGVVGYDGTSDLLGTWQASRIPLP
ncbi:MAG: hypothetical protein RDU25_04095 [Patescibacteria group bacterium]|nr:hypothetical protein [Patescibacteria group bacterium]